MKKQSLSDDKAFLSQEKKVKNTMSMNQFKELKNDELRKIIVEKEKIIIVTSEYDFYELRELEV